MKFAADGGTRLLKLSQQIVTYLEFYSEINLYAYKGKKFSHELSTSTEIAEVSKYNIVAIPVPLAMGLSMIKIPIDF